MSTTIEKCKLSSIQVGAAGPTLAWIWYGHRGCPPFPTRFRGLRGPHSSQSPPSQPGPELASVTSQPSKGIRFSSWPTMEQQSSPYPMPCSWGWKTAKHSKQEPHPSGVGHYKNLLVMRKHGPALPQSKETGRPTCRPEAAYPGLWRENTGSQSTFWH